MSKQSQAPLTWQRSLGILVLAAIAYGGQQLGCIAADDGPAPAATTPTTSSTAEPSRTTPPDSAKADEQPASLDAATLIKNAFRDGTSGFMITADGTVDRVLPDDNDGSRHQKFIVRLANDHTILVAHNIDLADRVPLDRGDAVRFHGQYEWNDRGGVIHWTHHDPRKRHEEGWIEHDGKRYE